jgi:hypothetical protein
MGVDAANEPACTQYRVPHLYDIPLRACVSRDLENLMFAGRNISATHIGFASTRVMATCAVVGQGVGTAAAYAARNGIVPQALAGNLAAVEEIQQQLLEDDAFLIGKVNTSRADFARRAMVTSSSEQAIGPAKNIAVGPTRSVHGDGGSPRERTMAGTHRWMSEAAAGLPAWVQLEWAEPISPRRMQVIFDTGMHRVMTFSLADSYTKQMHWGRPQEETVRDYRVETRFGGAWQALRAVKGNYQRRNSIDLEGRQFDGLRVVVEATNGLDHARICGIRIC